MSSDFSNLNAYKFVTYEDKFVRYSLCESNKAASRLAERLANEKNCQIIVQKESSNDWKVVSTVSPKLDSVLV